MKTYPHDMLRRARFALSIPWRRTLYILFFAQFITATGFSSFFPFLPLYVQDLGSQTGLSLEFLAGMVFSAQALTMMVASPFWGALADRLGRKVMVERAMFGGTVILLLMAFARSAEELVLLRALQGLVTGTIAAANALVASVTPREESGYAMGLLQVGLGSGVALGPLIGGFIADLYGYSAAFYVTAALLFISGILVWAGVQEDFHPSANPGAKGNSMLALWRDILSSPGVVIAYAMRFISQLGRNMIVPVAPLFIQLLLANSERVNTFTGLVTGAAAVTATISASYLGRLGDRIGHRQVLVAGSILAALFYLPTSLVTAGWQLLLLQALAGVAMGGIVPAIGALLANYTRAGLEGAVYGLDNSIDAGARSIAPLLGSGIALWFGLRATFTATALLFMGAALLAAWRLPKRRLETEVESELSATSD